MLLAGQPILETCEIISLVLAFLLPLPSIAGMVALAFTIRKARRSGHDVPHKVGIFLRPFLLLLGLETVAGSVFVLTKFS